MLIAAASQPATARSAAPNRSGTRYATPRPAPIAIRRRARACSDRGGRTRGTRWPSAASFADRAGRVKVACCRGRGLPWRHGLAAGARSERRRRRRGQLRRLGAAPARAVGADRRLRGRDARRAGDDPRRRRRVHGARGRGRRAARQRLRVPVARRRRPPRSGVASPAARRARAVAIVAADARSRGPTPAGGACRAATRHLRAARRHVHARGHVRRASPRSCRTCASSASPPSS